MRTRRENWVVAILIAVFLIAQIAPFLFAWQAADGSHVFGGFLLNPIDGNSYLAKMRQGYDGGWLFTLPYTAQPGEGAAINLYYLLLGHVAKWLALPLVLIFHAARLLGAFFLSLALYKFLEHFFTDANLRLWTFAIILFGSGLGWLGLAFGLFSMDFWVAEAYPFLASFANAHFPLGLALQVFILTSVVKADFRAIGLSALAALLLSIVYPFGWLICVAVLGAWLAWLIYRRTNFRDNALRWLAILAAGLPVSAYSLWVVRAYPVLAGWSAQNLTPTPNLLDLIIGFSPHIVLALFGVWMATKKNKREIFFLIVWLSVGLVLVYFPTDLQRRFVSGLYIPAVGLAVFAVAKLLEKSRRLQVALAALLVFSIPTNLIVLLGSGVAASRQDPALFLQSAELDAYAWLDEHARGKVVLAGPDSGLFIPAYSGANVIYGHPFETVNASIQRTQVATFYSGELDQEAVSTFLEGNSVEFVFYGPREQTLGPLPNLPGWQLSYSQLGVEIWTPSK